MCTPMCREGVGRSCVVQHAKDRGYHRDSDKCDDWMHVPYWVRRLRLMVMIVAIVTAGPIIDSDSNDDDGNDSNDSSDGR